MNSREIIERREGELLASHAMKSGESRGRRYPEEQHPHRSLYQRDRDRIVHSAAFRKLEYKTQVFVNHEGDNFRTRLTHSMEVSQIARSIARNLRLNEDLTEAIAISHDLGHTPFGHAGEDALNEALDAYRRRLRRELKSEEVPEPEKPELQRLFQEVEHVRFEHNFHSLRIVEKLETKYPEFRGLNLTWEVRESMAKHSSYRDNPLLQEYEPHSQPLLEAQIVDIADSIAYDNHDIEDSINMGIATERDFEETELWRQAVQWVVARYPSITPELRILQAIKYIINLEVTDLITHTRAMLERHRIQSVDDVRRSQLKLVQFSPDVHRLRASFQQFMFQRVYRHYKVVRMARKAHHFIGQLFAEFTSRHGVQLLPRKYQDWYREVGVIGICDYIAGMTDRQAQDEVKKLFHPFERV